ncbi:hypothetical protein D3C75_1084200 [compost metagenome]
MQPDDLRSNGQAQPRAFTSPRQIPLEPVKQPVHLPAINRLGRCAPQFQPQRTCAAALRDRFLEADDKLRICKAVFEGVGQQIFQHPDE